MKKLLSLVAVLALVLTLAPVATVNAASATILGVNWSWVKLSDGWNLKVTYSTKNAVGVAKAQVLYDGEVLEEAAFPGEVYVLWNVLTEDGYAAKDLTLRLLDNSDNTLGEWDFTIYFYKLETNLASSYKSGDYVTFTGTISLWNGAKFVDAGAPAPETVVFEDGHVDEDTGHGDEIASKTPDFELSADGKAYTFTVKNLRLTGYAGEDGSKLLVWFYDEDGNPLLKNDDVKFYRTTFSFTPSTVAFHPEGITLTIADRNGKKIPVGTPVVVWFDGDDYTAVVDNYSRITLTLNTPATYGTYTATVYSDTENDDWDVSYVDGFGTFTVSYTKGLVLGDLNYTTPNAEGSLSVYAPGATKIEKLWVTVEAQPKVLRAYYPRDPNGDGLYFWYDVYGVDSANFVREYKVGEYASPADVPVKDAYWTGFTGNTATIKVWPRQGGTFTVKVKALVGSTIYEASRTYTLKWYRVENVTLNPTPVVYGDEEAVAKVTVTTYDGKPVNNAVVCVGESDPGNNYFCLDGRTEPVDGGVYEVALYNADEDMLLAAGTYPVKVWVDDDDAGWVLMSYQASAVTVNRLEDYTLTLSSDKVFAGGSFTATVKNENGKLVTTPVDVYIDAISSSYKYDTLTPNNGKITIETTNALFKTVGAGSHKLIVVQGNHMAQASFTVEVPVVATSPADGKINNVIGDVVAFKWNEGVNYNNIDLVSNTVYVVDKSDVTKVGYEDAVDLSEVEPADVDPAARTGSFYVPAYTDYDFGKVTLRYKTGDVYWKVATFAVSNEFNLSFVETPTLYVGDTVTLKVKLTDVHGNPVPKYPVKIEQMGYLVAGGEQVVKTDANGIANFGSLYVAMPGVLKATTDVAEAKIVIYATKPAPPKPAVEIILSINQDIYTFNGQIKFWDAAPYIKNGRTMVPLRALAEALGFQVGWDGATKTVSIWKADQNPAVDTPYIMLQIGTTTAKVGSALYELDVAAEIVNGRTMVPLRFVAENLGYTVQWTPPSTVTLVKP